MFPDDMRGGIYVVNQPNVLVRLLNVTGDRFAQTITTSKLLKFALSIKLSPGWGGCRVNHSNSFWIIYYDMNAAKMPNDNQQQSVICHIFTSIYLHSRKTCPIMFSCCKLYTSPFILTSFKVCIYFEFSSDFCNHFKHLGGPNNFYLDVMHKQWFWPRYSTLRLERTFPAYFRISDQRFQSLSGYSLFWAFP